MRPGRPSSRQEGVEWDANSGKWSASFDDDAGETIFVGQFDTEWRAILRQDFAQMRWCGMVSESMSYERFLAWRPIVEKRSLYDAEHLMQQAWLERRRNRKASATVRRRGD